MDWILKGAALCVSFSGWLALFKWVRYLFARFLALHKKDVSYHHLMNVCEATVCIIQSVITSVCGIIIVTSCRHDVMWATHSLTSWYALVLASYFLYDTIIMYKVHLASNERNCPTTFSGHLISFVKRRPLLIAHHLVIAFILCPLIVIINDIGNFFIGCFYCVELSGPFTNMRVLLSRFGLKYSKWYLLNGILMILSFTLCRVMLFPFMYMNYGSTYGLRLVDVIRSIPLHCNLGCLLVLLPQIYWLWLMILGAIKLSKGKRISEADEKID